jgi:GTP-binding protein HflX
VILSDTVGFISDIPTMLVAAFRATLEEVVEADRIVHVRDISHPETEAQRQDVEGVLEELGIDVLTADAPVLEVWNKADRLNAAEHTEAERAIARSNRHCVLVSALTGEGIDAFRDALDAHFGAGDEIVVVEIPAREGRLLSWLHDNAEVLRQEPAPNGAVTARFRINAAVKGKFEGQLKRAGLSPLLSRDGINQRAAAKLDARHREGSQGSKSFAPLLSPDPKADPSRPRSTVKASGL